MKFSSSPKPRGAEIPGAAPGRPDPGNCSFCERGGEYAYRPYRQRKGPPGQGTYVLACGKHWKAAAAAMGWLGET